MSLWQMKGYRQGLSMMLVLDYLTSLAVHGTTTIQTSQMQPILIYCQRE